MTLQLSFLFQDVAIGKMENFISADLLFPFIAILLLLLLLSIPNICLVYQVKLSIYLQTLDFVTRYVL